MFFYTWARPVALRQLAGSCAIDGYHQYVTRSLPDTALKRISIEYITCGPCKGHRSVVMEPDFSLEAPE